MSNSHCSPLEATSVQGAIRVRAAAPDMLAAHRENAVDLEHLMNNIDANEPLPAELFDRIVECLSRTRDAIDKATGAA